MGTDFWNSSMASAVEKQLVSEATVTTAARRGLMQRMVQGDFDAVQSVEWSKIGPAVVNSSAHQAVAYDAALQAMVLLKNTGGVLPLRPGAKIAVVGPGGVAQKGLVGPYFGDCICYAPHQDRHNYSYACIPTIAGSIAAANTGGTTAVAEGITVTGFDDSGVAAALKLVDEADVVVLAIGLDHTVEHEGWDVANTSLPGLQASFAQAVLARKKPTVTVLLGDDGTGIDQLVGGSAAVVRAFYPSLNGAQALASLLFGTANRWGKLPVTMYPAGYTDLLPKMGEHTGTAFSMAHGPGRSYRYYKGTPPFPFGRGLSLTTFGFSCAPAVLQRGTINTNCTVINTGTVVGDEVLQVYHVVGDAVRAKASKLHAVPFRQLVEFERISDLAPRVSRGLSFSLDVQAALSLTSANGSRVVYPGAHQLVFSTGVPGVPDVVHTVTV